MQIPHTIAETNFVLADQLDEHPNLHAIVRDAERFLLGNKDIVQRAPLQTYASALVFSPYGSRIRKENSAHFPTWFSYGPVVEDHWGPVLQTLPGHSTPIAALAFSFDGKYLASLSQNCELLLWDAMTGTLHITLTEGSPDFFLGPDFFLSPLSSIAHFSLAFSSNGQLASLSSGSEVRVWDPATGVMCRNIMHHRHLKVVAIAFASDDTLAVAYTGSPPEAWIYEAGALPILLETKVKAKALSFLSEETLALLSPNREKEGGEIVLYNPKRHAKRCIPICGFGAATFSSNDQLALAQWNQQGTSTFISIYDLRKDCYQTWKISVNGATTKALAFSSNNRGLFVGSNDGSVQLWNLVSGIITVVWTGSSAIASIAAAPDSRLAIASRVTGGIRILEVRSDSMQSNGDQANGSKHWCPTPLSVSRIMFSPNGKQLVYSSGDGLHVLGSATQRELHFLQSHDISSITISGKYVASGLTTGAVHVWDLASGNLLKTLKGRSEYIDAVALSPDNRVLLAIGVSYSAIDIWDIRTWSLLRPMPLRIF